MESKTVRVVVGERVAVCVTVERADELPEPELMLRFRCGSVERFEDAIERFGGVDAFRFPERESYWDEPAIHKGEGVMVFVHPPPPSVVGVSGRPAAPHPFHEAYRAKQVAK